MVTVVRYGTDSSGRAILATPKAVKRLDGLIAACQNASKLTGGDVKSFTPVIVQGAFMASLGGGAPASEGYHDKAGCYDFRIWNLSAAQVGFLIREARRRGIAIWVRNAEHGGMDPHAHGVICDDTPLAAGAVFQVAEYRAGRNGLASRGHDYHWRPDPLVLAYDDTPPVKTPNITRALAAKTTAARKANLRLVVEHGSPKAKAAASKWLSAILNAEAASKRLTATRKAAQRDLESLAA